MVNKSSGRPPKIPPKPAKVTLKRLANKKNDVSQRKLAVHFKFSHQLICKALKNMIISKWQKQMIIDLPEA